jgi:hypothetical protein
LYGAEGNSHCFFLGFGGGIRITDRGVIVARKIGRRVQGGLQKLQRRVLAAGSLADLMRSKDERAVW